MHRMGIAGLLLATLAASAMAQECIRYDDYLRYIGGQPTVASPNRTLLVEDRLYAGAADGTLYIIDVSMPSSPAILGEVFVDAVGTWSLAIGGEYLYMGVGGEIPGIMSRIHVIDVSVPSSPALVNSTFIYDWPRGMEIAGGHLYVSCNGDGLRIFSLAYPGALFQIGQNWIPGYCIDVAIHGDFAYVTKNNPAEGITILHIGDPTAPVIVGSLATPEQSFECLVMDDLLYVAAGDDGLNIYGLTDPEAPVLVGHLTLDGFDPTHNIEIAGDVLFATGGYQRLFTVDISLPTSPTLLARLETGHHALDASANGEHCFISQNFYGVHAYDVNPAVLPAMLGTASTQWSALDIASSGSLAYVVTTIGLLVLEMTEPGTYNQLAALPVGAPPALRAKVVAHGDFVYTGATYEGIDVNRVWVRVFDVADPGNPELRGETWFDVNYIYDLDYADGHLYASNRWPTQIIDVSDPGNPTIVGSGGYNIQEASIDGALLFAAAQSDGLQIYDISVPGTMELVGGYATPVSKGVASEGGIACLAADDDGLLVFDVSNPANPTLLGEAEASWNTKELHLADGILYAAEHGDMVVYDVRDPAEPAILGTVYAESGGALTGFAGFDSFLVAVRGSTSLRYYAYHCPDLTSSPGGPAMPSVGMDIAAWPNPFNPHTTLRFRLHESGTVSLDLYDVCGRQVRHLAYEPFQAGVHQLVWNGLDDSGRSLPSGIYFARLSGTGGTQAGNKLVLLR